MYSILLLLSHIVFSHSIVITVAVVLIVTALSFLLLLQLVVDYLWDVQKVTSLHEDHINFEHVPKIQLTHLRM